MPRSSMTTIPSGTVSSSERSRSSLSRCAASAALRSLMSRMIPTKIASPATFASPTERSIGKVEPSLRLPATSRPMPMIFFSPVRR